jgi:hypothetical protein
MTLIAMNASSSRDGSKLPARDPAMQQGLDRLSAVWPGAPRGLNRPRAGYGQAVLGRLLRLIALKRLWDMFRSRRRR